MKSPKKKDWINTIYINLEELEIKLTLEEIELLPKATFKKLVKNQIKEKAFNYLINQKEKRNGKGIEIHHLKHGMQNYLKSEDMDINNDERKLILQLRTKMNFKVKSHFKRMHTDTICDGCRKVESTTRHSLECPVLLGKNEIITYLPQYGDLYGNDENEQVYIARIFRDNMRRLPENILYT